MTLATLDTCHLLFTHIVHGGHTSFVSRLRREIAQLEMAQRDGKADLVSLERSFAAARDKVERLERVVGEAEDARDGLETERQSLSATGRQATTMVRSLQEEKEALRRDNAALSADLARHRDELRATVRTAEEKTAVADRLQGRERLLASEVERYRDELDRQRSAAEQAEAARATLANLQGLPDIVRELEGERGSLRDKLSTCEVARQRVERDSALARRAAEDAVTEAARHRRSSERLGADLEAAKAGLRDMERRLSEADARVAQVTSDRDQIARLHSQSTSELTKRAQLDHERVEEFAEVAGEIEQHRAAFEGARREADRLQGTSAACAAELNQVHRLLQSSKGQELDARRELERLSGSVAEGERERGLLLAEVEELRALGDSAAGEAQRRRLGEAEALDREQAAQEELGQLRQLFKNLDATRSQLDGRLRDCYGQLEEKERAVAALRDQISGARREAQDGDREATRQRDLVRAVDSQRDELQCEVDSMAEQLAETTGAWKKLEVRAAALEKEVDGGARQSEVQTRILHDRDRQIRSLRTQVDATQGQVQSLKENARLRASELAALNGDLVNMTRENQAVNGDWAKLKQAVEEKQRQLDASLQQGAYDAERLRAAQVDREQLLAQYRGAAGERDRLVQVVQQTSADKAAIQGAERELQGALGRARTELAELRSEHKRTLVDIAGYDRRVSELARQLAESRSTAEAADNASAQMRQTATQQRDNAMAVQQDAQGTRSCSYTIQCSEICTLRNENVHTDI